MAVNIHEHAHSVLLDLIKKMHTLSAESDTEGSHEKHRASTERFSQLVAPTNIDTEAFFVGEIPCEMVRPVFPHRKDHVILYCHGGGNCNGGLNYARILAAKMAIKGGVSVVTFAYSLAPEHKYPTQLNEAEEVWNQLLLKGFGSKQIFVAGDSAGANLALDLCLRLKEQGRFLPKALLLFSPWTDMREIQSSYEIKKDSDPVLSYDFIDAARKDYAGKDADFSNPYFSPLLADLSGFPPVLIQVGENEILLDDSRQLAKKLTQLHIPVNLEIFPEGWHVFQQFPVSLANRAMESVGQYIMDS